VKQLLAAEKLTSKVFTELIDLFGGFKPLLRLLKNDLLVRLLRCKDLLALGPEQGRFYQVALGNAHVRSVVLTAY
jgi:hypothetical protein